jgi:hypothetical protein
MHVVTCVSNPHGWRTRIDLATKAVSSWVGHGAAVTLVECAHGDRAFELSGLPRIRHIGVRATTTAWSKENLLNIGIASLPHGISKIATIDADVTWRDDSWMNKTVKALDLWPVVQMWSDALDLGPRDEILQHHVSFGRQLVAGFPIINTGKLWKFEGGPFDYPHPGYAWAWTRGFLDSVGGLIDFCGMGSGDYHMALGMVGYGQKSVDGRVGTQYMDAILAWQARALKSANGKLGHIWSTIEHPFHGTKANRAYQGRWEMFVKHGFDPHTDLKRNSYGVIEFAGNKPELERDWDRYLLARDEDSNASPLAMRPASFMNTAS